MKAARLPPAVLRIPTGPLQGPLSSLVGEGHQEAWRRAPIDDPRSSLPPAGREMCTGQQLGNKLG